MKLANPELLKLLVSVLPLSFLERLLESLPGIYSEAYQMAFADPLLEKPEAEYLMPHSRRAIFESVVRNAALAGGLRAEALYTLNRTARFTAIQAGELILTVSYECKKGWGVREARFRSDRSALNKRLAQRRFESMDTPDMLAASSGTVYAILLHGADDSDRTKPGYMEFGFPDSDNNVLVDRINFMDVLEAARLKNPESAPQDSAFPTWKRQPKEKGDT